MNLHLDDFTPTLRKAISEVRSLGFIEAADSLERSIFSAYTTSSEWLGESGQAITSFLNAHNSELPTSLVSEFNICLIEIAKVWPKYRP